MSPLLRLQNNNNDNEMRKHSSNIMLGTSTMRLRHWCVRYVTNNTTTTNVNYINNEQKEK